MSLNRTALRLAVLEALAPHAQYSAGSPAWPTLAMGNVSDSDEILPLGAQALQPRIVVYVDDAKRENAATGDALLRGYGTDEVTLALEVIVPQVVKDEAGNELAVAAASDSIAESILDLIGDQIEHRLQWARMDGLLVHVLSGVRKTESRPWRDADTDIRLAARRFEFECMIFSTGAWPVDVTGFDKLPFPLDRVAKALPSGSHGANVCTTLAALINAPETFAAFNEMRLAFNMTREAGDASAPEQTFPADASPTGDVAGSVALP